MLSVQSEIKKPLKSKVQFFSYDRPFGLECGSTLPELTIAYTTYGSLNANGDNVVWVFHALTANADPSDWWPEIVGEGKVIDPKDYFIVCANILGSCYGTTGPESFNSVRVEKYGLDFPFITIKDMVNAHKLLKSYLGISSIYLGIGGSMGGQQLLEWTVLQPKLFKNIVLLATNAHHSAWGIAFNSSQRLALEADATFGEKFEGAGSSGLKAARSIAMLSYRSPVTYRKTQTDFDSKIDGFKADSYQRYQGEKLVKRFSPYSYWTLSKAMDSHHIGRGRKSVRSALKAISANTLVIGIRSDLLFPIAEQQFIAKNVKNGSFELIDSNYGHDGFLIEDQKISQLIKDFIK